ncbi:Uma2 family endonuclease [Candidatus Poribacteria bacterium]|nr:Uma2 family endonuclease [Candidatus Poribacteria bacterium]MYA99638.1 Uma2 family endonuclease [Candidatus Poribacteria bacterium]
MNTANDFELKQRKYMPVFPKASGKPTIYIEGYPYEDDEPMPAGEFHGMQMHSLFDQFLRYFQAHPHIHVGMDNFIYYREGDIRKVVAPDVYVVLGAAKLPLRRSFYTWAEGTVPTAVFEFLSDTTASEDRHEKVEVYLRDMGVAEYFIHQPDMNRPIEFQGWRRDALGDIVEIEEEADDGLFSASLNLYFRWEVHEAWELRLLRPYLPDGTAITTSMEEHHLRVAAEELATAEAERRQAAEGRAREEAERRQAIEAELERLRTQLANSENEANEHT